MFLLPWHVQCRSGNNGTRGWKTEIVGLDAWQQSWCILSGDLAFEAKIQVALVEPTAEPCFAGKKDAKPEHSTARFAGGCIAWEGLQA